MAEAEKKNDVTKKRDLTDFYRDILSQRTADVATSVAANVQGEMTGRPSTASDDKVINPQPPAPKDLPSNSEEYTEERPVMSKSTTPTEERPVIKKINTDNQRTYRSRRVTSTSDHARDAETESEGNSDEESGTEAKEDRQVSKKEENMDRDDSDSSDSDDDEGDENKDKAEGDDENKVAEEVEDALPKVQMLLLSEEEQKEERIKMVKESCKKRNTPETIQAAIERYWKRQAALTA